MAAMDEITRDNHGCSFVDGQEMYTQVVSWFKTGDKESLLTEAEERDIDTGWCGTLGDCVVSLFHGVLKEPLYPLMTLLVIPIMHEASGPKQMDIHQIFESGVQFARDDPAQDAIMDCFFQRDDGILEVAFTRSSTALQALIDWNGSGTPCCLKSRIPHPAVTMLPLSREEQIPHLQDLEALGTQERHYKASEAQDILFMHGMSTEPKVLITVETRLLLMTQHNPSLNHIPNMEIVHGYLPVPPKPTAAVGFLRRAIDKITEEYSSTGIKYILGNNQAFLQQLCHLENNDDTLMATYQAATEDTGSKLLGSVQLTPKDSDLRSIQAAVQRRNICYHSGAQPAVLYGYLCALCHRHYNAKAEAHGSPAIVVAISTNHEHCSKAKRT
ncbi:hypothetical protein Pelo_2981 [Pelomyxa schiedti]|nr:hypothetical protein Pelo_2981 [Pelomyxa schiedti]